MRPGTEAFLLVVRRHNIIEKLENVSHCEEELQGAEKQRDILAGFFSQEEAGCI